MVHQNHEEKNAARFSNLRQEKGPALLLNTLAFFDSALMQGALVIQ